MITKKQWLKFLCDLQIVLEKNNVFINEKKIHSIKNYEILHFVPRNDTYEKQKIIVWKHPESCVNKKLESLYESCVFTLSLKKFENLCDKKKIHKFSKRTKKLLKKIVKEEKVVNDKHIFYI